MSIKFLLISFLLPCLISTEPIALTDQTWREMLEGQWMVEFYAPWCPACIQFRSVWNEFSQVMASKNVKVAAVDIEQYPSLSGRFSISALPTIFYVHDGVFRQYKSGRSLRNLNKFIDNQEWQNTSPVSSYISPNSILMSLASSLFDLSNLVKSTHTLLQDYYGWPSWVIYSILVIGVLCAGMLIGFGCLEIFDYFLSGSSRNYANTIPDDGDDLEESDSDRVIQSKKLTTDESQGDEELESDENNLSNEEIEDKSEDETAAAAAEEEEEDQGQITADQTIRRRQLNS